MDKEQRAGGSRLKQQDQPKLYIKQPPIQYVRRNMQKSFDSRRKNWLREERINMNENTIPSKNEFMRKKKKFTDMNIEEKIYYILFQQSDTPKLKCKVQTEQRKFVGYIQSFENNKVEMKLPGRENVITLSLEAIQAVHLLGF